MFVTLHLTTLEQWTATEDSNRAVQTITQYNTIQYMFGIETRPGTGQRAVYAHGEFVIVPSFPSSHKARQISGHRAVP
jgi:hypothetical protein